MDLAVAIAVVSVFYVFGYSKNEECCDEFVDSQVCGYLISQYYIACLV